MVKKLNIAMIAAEVAPFSKTGGLADVARSLPKALNRLGHNLIVITPFYGQIIDREKHHLKLVYQDLSVRLNSDESITINVYRGFLMPDLPVYFIENHKYFSKKKHLYGSSHENVRFLIFDAATLKLLSVLDFKPQIIHCHDWHTGLIPYYLKNDFQYSKNLKKAKTVFTIHNLAYQFGHNWWEVPPDKKDFGIKRLPHISNPDIEYINFAKRAIMSADVINTVSESYRNEIMTKSFGQDLHRILKRREHKLFGIINGIDYYDYNPSRDPSLVKNYNAKTCQLKKINKIALQRKFSLKVDEDEFLICSTSRVVFQKGFALILEILDQLIKLDLQLIIMGDGDKNYINSLKQFNRRYPKKIVWLPFNENASLETFLYAASDAFMLPSHHEPCGINQLIAMRYGAIPIVRNIGGLSDTVVNYSPRTNRGTGFTFNLFSGYALYGAVVRALENYRYQKNWRQLVERAMLVSSSWEIPAKKYLKLYRRILSRKI